MKNIRKTLNLIALTVFMGSNLLTPISYAVDDLENVGENLQSETSSESVGSTYDITGGGDSLTNLGDDEDLSDGADGSEEKEASELEDSVDDSGESDTQGFTQETQENADDTATKDAKTDTDNTVLDPSLIFHGEEAPTPSSPFPEGEEKGLEQNAKTQKTADDTATEKAKTDTDDTVLDYSFQTVGEEGDILTPSPSFELSGDNLEQSLTGEVEELTGTDLELSIARETLNEEGIKDTKTYNKVTVNVEALTGTFPQGTELRIKPITIKKELNEIKEQIIDSHENIVEESELVAFDISFIYTLSDGTEVEVQPKNGEGVKVTFNYEENEDLSKADETEEQEIKVFHIDDKDENGEKLAQGEEKVVEVTNIEESKEDGIAVADAESFSIYAVIRSSQPGSITITYNANGGTFNGGLTGKQVTYTKDANDLYIASENVQAPDRDGYMFAGWYLQQGDATSQTTEWYGIQTDTTETTKTVYAKWLPFENKTVDLGEIGSFDIMDRNMGAEAVSDGLYNNKTANQLGYYYQWGNNYGFKNSGSVPYSVTTQIDITGKGYGPGNYYSSATFVKRTSSPYRWDTDTSSTTYTSYGNLNLWGGENTSNPDSWRQGPCPEGYHVPDTLEWKAAYELFKSWANTTAGQAYCATFTDDNTTYRPKCFASKLALPFAGYRYDNDSNVRSQGADGRYWSSSPRPSNASYSYRLGFDSSSVSPQNYASRAYGFSVRCFKNSSTQALTFSRNGEIIDTKNVRRWEPITTSYKPANPSGTTENWYTDSELTSQFTFGNTTYVTEAKTLYSKITCNNSSYIWNGTECVQQFTVTLNATTNGGTITPTSVTVANGAHFPLENYIASKDGYTFEGWAETSGTTGVLTSNPTITANKTLYAVFSKSLTGTFNKDDSTVSSISDTKATCTLRNTASNCILTAPTITCEAGYSNGVWDPSSMTISANTTFTARCSDAEKPVCSVTTQPTRTSMSLVNGYNQGTVTFTCTDNVGVSTTNLSASNINYDSNVVTLSNFTAGGESTSKTFTFTYTANAQGSTTFTLKAGAVSDGAGNSNVVTDASNTVTVDTTAPTITITEPNAGTWTQSKSVTASASDGTLTMKESTSSTCNSSVQDFVTYADKNYISESDNGKYICYKAVDSVGNTRYLSSAKIEKIDRTAPVLSGKTTFLSTWYTAPQTSTFTYTDTGAGINEGYNTAECTISNEGTASTCQITPNICDKVGNCNTTTQTSNSIKLDKTAPVFTGKTQFTTDWYNTDQTSTFTYEDTVSGINGDSTTSCVINEEGTTATCTVENTNICNNAGLCNTTNETSYSIKLDKTNPTCSITGNPTSPTNQNVELTLNYLVEANQISDGYSWNGEIYSTTQKLTVSENGTYTGYVKDAAGNTGKCIVTVSMIDKVLPNIEIDNPDATPAQSKTITATTDKGTLYMAITGTNVCNDSLDFVAYESITFSSESDNGKYVCYKAEDEAGNVKYGISAQISGIDTTAPVIGFANDVKKGPSQSDLVEVNWGDATVKKWRYSDTSGCSNNETLYDKTDADSMDQDTEANNGKYICLFASDTAGNIATKASANPINIDITNPTCEIEGNPTEWRNQPATLTVEMVDANVDENGYSWDDDQHYGNTTTKEISNNGTYVAYVRDLAGNTGTCNVEVTKFDNTKPLASVTSTNNLKSTSQTATLSCGDGVGVTKYYRGNKSNPTDGDYTAISSTTEFNKDEAVTSAGTYYLFCKDDAGNVSDSVSQTYYSYEVHNMLNAIDKAEGVYDATNYPQASTYTYIAPAGTTITFANVYTVPQYSSGTQYLGYTTSDNGNPSDGANVSLDDNSTYYFWFNRAKHGLTLQINTGIEKIYYKVNSGSEYSSVSSTTVVSMKEGSNAYVYATASNGYELTDAFKDYNADSPKTWNNITSQQTFLPNASIITYSIDYELDGGELETGKTNPEEYTVETPNFVLNNPIKDGYTFAGWTGTSLSDATETVTVTRGSFGDREYTATYNINNYNYRVEYYYDGDLSGAVTETASATFQDVINSYTGKNIDGYKLDHESGLPLTITSTVENNVIKVYYVKDNFDYSIEYYYNNVKDDAKTVTGKAEFASQITTYPDKLIAGYVLSGTVGLPLTITSNPVNNLIKVYYKKSSDLSYTIKYKDTENNTLSGDVVVPNQTFGDVISVTPGAIEGYVTPSAKNVTITSNSSANVVTFTYNKRTDLTYTIKYQNSAGTSISGDVVVENQTFGAEVTVVPGAIEGYVAPASTGFTIGVTNPDVVFVYTERNDLTYTIRYVDTNNHELSGHVVVNGQTFGDNVVVNAPQFPGYNTPASTGFTIKVVNPDVVFIYTPRDDIEYTVTYKDKYGSGLLADKTVNTGVMDTNVTENAPSIDGYQVQTGSFTIKLKATNNHIDFVYNPKEYAITFVDGSGVETTVVRSGEYVSTILNKNYPDWSKDGYTIHWDKAVPEKMPLYGIVITATWTPNTNTQYLVYHQKEKLDGSYETVSVYTGYGTTDTKVTPTVNSYPGFNSPEPQEITISGNGNTTLTYQYSRKIITLTLNNDNGSQNTIITGKYESNVQKPTTNPSKTGYTFTAWSPVIPDTFPAISGTYTAQWNIVTYGITYHLNGGTQVNPKETYTIETDSFTLINPTRDNYIFAGWTGSNGDELQTTVTITKGTIGPKEYFANWYEDFNHNGQNDATETKYTVKFVAGEHGTLGGTTTYSGILSGYTLNDVVGYTEPSKNPVANYIFSGWTPSLNVNTKITSNVVYTGIFAEDFNHNGINDATEPHFTVRYTDGVDGQVVFTDQVTSNILSGLATPLFNGSTGRDNYIFAGWTPSVADKVTGDATYTASWYEDFNHDGQNDATETKIVVRFLPGEHGSLAGTTVYEVLSGLTLASAGYTTAPTVTPDSDYMFSGWNAEIDTVNPLTSNVDYTAIYGEDKNHDGQNDEKEDKYTVTINYVYSRGGTATGSYTTGNQLSGFTYNVPSPTITNYHADKITVSGTITGNVNLTVTYSPNTDTNHNEIADEEETPYKVTVNYEYSRGGESSPSVSGMYLSGIVFNFVSPNIPNYTPNSGTISGTGIEADQTFTVIYRPNTDENNDGYADEEETHYTLTIHYINTHSGTVFTDYTASLVSGASYNVVSQTKNHYTVSPATVSGVMSNENVEVYVIYTPDNDTNNNGIADEEENITPSNSGSNSSGGGGRRIVTPTTHGVSDAGNDTKDQQSINEDNNKNQNNPVGNKDSELIITDKNTKNYSSEVIDAYKWAYANDITTINSLDKAKPDNAIIRGHMAKVVVNYAVNVLGKEMPKEIPSYCKWNDNVKDWESKEIKEYAEKACALGIMGINVKSFQPKKVVTRAEFGTILSRILRGDKYNETKASKQNPYYAKHLKALKENGIMTKIDNPLNRKELREWVWVMLKRTAEM